MRTPTDRKSEGDPAVGVTANARIWRMWARRTAQISNLHCRKKDVGAQKGACEQAIGDVDKQGYGEYFSTWRWKNSCKMRETRKTDSWQSTIPCIIKCEQTLRMAPSLP